MKLSETMLKALAVIGKTGGEAIPVPGGYWLDANHARLEFPVDDWRRIAFVETNTIHALERRGMLERTNRHERGYRDPRKLTEAGRAALADKEAG